MSVPAFNKVTRSWTSTETGTELTPPQDWIINPMFSPDQETAMMMGPEFWSYSGNTITTVSLDEYNAVMRERAQRTKWLEIQAERDRRKWNGVKIGNFWFHSDDSSRIQQIGLCIMALNNQIPPNLMWKTLSGEFTIMTNELALQIFQATATQDITLFTIAEQHRQQMLADATPQDYNFMNGWPLTFGE